MKTSVLKKPIFVVGGMGPQASANFYQRLLEKSVSIHGAVHNEDFPHVIIDSLSMPDFISNKARQDEAISLLQKSVARAELQNPVAVAMACNTGHLFVKQMLGDSNIPFVSLIDTVVGAVSSQGLSTVGLVASPTTINSELYQTALKNSNIQLITPEADDLKRLERIIRTVISGKAGLAESEALLRIVVKLKLRGAKGVILGCTELPLVFPISEVDSTIFDCLELLALALTARYYEQ